MVLPLRDHFYFFFSNSYSIYNTLNKSTYLSGDIMCKHLYKGGQARTILSKDHKNIRPGDQYPF
jgi:hypothetical protein